MKIHRSVKLVSIVLFTDDISFNNSVNIIEDRIVDIVRTYLRG